MNKVGHVSIYFGRGKEPLLKTVQLLSQRHQEGKNCILLVPEQYTLQGEQDILRLLNLPGFFNIHVLSPSRLCHRIFEQRGKDPRTPIDALGKQIAIAQALLKAEKNLRYYQSIVRSRGFGEKMLTEIDRWKQGGYTLSQLKIHEEQADLSPSLKAKIADIYQVWMEYEKVLKAQFIDGSAVTKDAVDRVVAQPLFEDDYLFVYGFDLLSYELRELLFALGGQCAQVTIAISGDAQSAPDGQIFAPAWRSVRQLTKGLKKCGIGYGISFIKNEPPSLLPEDIYHLTKNLFAYPVTTYPKAPKNLFMHIAPTIYDEVDQVANQLIRLNSQGIPWDEMGVLLGDISAYSTLVYGLFTSYQIPFYLDVPTSGLDHGLIRFVVHGIRAATKGYQKEDILACIKSGYAPLTSKECDQLENYILAYGIKGRQWTKPFVKGGIDVAGPMEEIRMLLIGPLERFGAGLLESSTTFASLQSVMTLLEDIGAYQRLLDQETALLALGLNQSVSHNRQVWQLILRTLDQMYHLMEGRRIPAVHIASWLEGAFLSSQLHGLPPSQNSLFCGELGHALPGNLSVLFALGLNDGLLKRETATLFTDQEQALFEKDKNNPSFLSSGDLAHLAYADLVRSFSLPSRFLYLSYPQSNIQGQVLRPLPQIDRITRHIFPQLEVTGGALQEEPVPPLSPSPALAKIGALLKKHFSNPGSANQPLPNHWEEAFASLYAHPAYQAPLREVLLALTEKSQIMPLSPPLAQALFGKEVLSVSRLETFAQCPYRHFVQYGLRPVDRAQWALTPQDIGTFYHRALKNYTKEITDAPAWPHITKKQSDALMEKALAPFEKELFEGPMGETLQTHAQARRYQTTLKTAAWVFTKQAKESNFRPSQAEVSFGYENSLLPPIFLSLANGEKAMVRGVIDRVDQFKGEQSIYLRVVDYKSSSQELDPAALWCGVQLQLVLYLHAAISYDDTLFPAGAFYFHIDDPLVQMDEDLVEAAEEEIAKNLKLKGITLADPEVYRAMDQREKPAYIEKMFNIDGRLTQGAKAFSLKEMRALLNRSLTLANGFANEIYQGHIALAPAQLPQKPACMYCQYQGICGIEPANEGKFIKVLPAMTMEALKEHLVSDQE